jgi:hypothetical protein
LKMAIVGGCSLVVKRRTVTPATEVRFFTSTPNSYMMRHMMDPIIYIVPMLLCLIFASAIGWMIWADDSRITRADVIRFFIVSLCFAFTPILNIGGALMGLVFTGVCITECGPVKSWLETPVRGKYR